MSYIKKLVPGLLLILLCLNPVSMFPCPEQTKDKPETALTENDKSSSKSTNAPHHRKIWRAFLENGVLLTASTLDYWGSYGHFTVDWQFTWKTFGQKFFTAQSPKMDSNAFWFNWSHSFSGAAYYDMARINGLNSGVSTLFSFGLSTIWETFTEWRELISTNDMTFTTFGGPALGEPLFQIGSYFSHRQGLLNRVAECLFNPFLAANNWFDRGSGPAWNSGPDASWHRFSLFAGLREAHVSPAGTTAVGHSGTYYRQFNVGLDMETNSVPGYGRAQTGSRFLSDTLSCRVFFDLSYSSAGMEEINIRSRAVLFGFSWQSVLQDQNGNLHGHTASLGFGTAWELFIKRPVAWYDSTTEVPSGGQATVGMARFLRPTPTQFTDKLCTISPLGAVFNLSFFGPRLLIRWTTEAYGDFAMVNALAYNQFTESHDTSGVKTTLLNWGYYYALGMTMASDIDTEWRQWHVRAAASYQWYDSIQGQDRYQYMGLVTDDFKISDTRLVWRFKLGYHLAHTPAELGLVAEGIGRRGSLLDIRAHYWEKRFYYQLGILF